MVQFQWIKTRLKSLGKTQRELAQHLGVVERAITESIKGDRQWKPHELKSVAEFLGLPYSAMLTGGDNTPDVQDFPLVATINSSGVIKPIAGEHGMGEIALKAEKYSIEQDPLGPEYLLVDEDLPPLLPKGSKLKINRTIERPQAECIGWMCAVWCKDGRRLFRRLELGERAATYNLHTWRYEDEPERNVEVTAFYRIEFD